MIAPVWIGLGIGLALHMASDQDDSIPSVTPEVVLQLPPGPGNPRNSEGDFIRLADGRLQFIYTHFTGGGADHDAAHLASRTSDDGGRTWTETDERVLPNEGDQNVMSVSLLRLEDGEIALFYLRKNSSGDCLPLMRRSADEGQSWSDPVAIITDEPGYYVLNNDRVVQLSSGRLVVPVAHHADPAGNWRPGVVHCYLSDDAGQTWRRNQTSLSSPVADDPRGLMEPGVVEWANGELFMVLRTRLGRQYTARSKDGGETWTDPEPRDDLLSPESPASVKLIPSTGDLLMIWNDHRERTEKDRRERPQARTPLVASISRDGGRTWSMTRVLEDAPDHGYCYTAMTFIDDRVLLAHCAGALPSILATTQITMFDVDWLDEP
ncbi:hypothetical protein BH23PLA1_BH23PLA1_02250 [soil metagenome]